MNLLNPMHLLVFKIWVRQDLTSSSAEMASKAGSGVEMNLDFVPQRETGMTAYEMMFLNHKNVC